jgi:DNA-directed RNA polymerase specialized sigma24 family protein
MMNGHQHTPAAALMTRYCDGEAAAFLPLYEQIAPDVFGHLLDRTGDRTRAEALLQKTFIQLHERRCAYVRGADPLPWAMTIAEHLAAREVTPRPAWLLRAIDRIGRSSRKGSSRQTDVA